MRAEVAPMPADRIVMANAPAALATQGAEQARHIAQQLAAAMPSTASGTTEITLRPEELGQVRMRLTLNEGAMTMVIHADRQETSDLMRRHIDQLAQTYRQMGFDNLSFSFSGSTNREAAHQASPDDALAQTLEEPTSNQIAPPTAATTSGRLDLRI